MARHNFLVISGLMDDIDVTFRIYWANMYIYSFQASLQSSCYILA